MAKKNPQIDAYIAKAPAYAPPILTRLRKVVHTGCPDLEEGLKWRVPAFMYKGILCGMAAFKDHASFIFWKGDLMKQHGLSANDSAALDQCECLRTVKDLPSDKTLLRLIHAAVALQDAGVKAPRKPLPKGPRSVKVPADLTAALAKNTKAKTQFAGFSYSKKKDYVEWLSEAKTDATRKRRLETAVCCIAEGKGRNWKYESR